ncbi:hypothetical protein [Breoghania sp.]|nr:hypothetical protein [Breoghania sp.]MDJ0931816.1 hypothetical protein [Breoghania sp.]
MQDMLRRGIRLAPIPSLAVGLLAIAITGLVAGSARPTGDFAERRS